MIVALLIAIFAVAVIGFLIEHWRTRFPMQNGVRKTVSVNVILLVLAFALFLFIFATGGT